MRPGTVDQGAPPSPALAPPTHRSSAPGREPHGSPRPSGSPPTPGKGTAPAAVPSAHPWTRHRPPRPSPRRAPRVLKPLLETLAAPSRTTSPAALPGRVTCSATVLDHEGHVPHARHDAPLLDKVNCRPVSAGRGATWRSPAPLSLLWPMSWWRSGSGGGTDRRAGGDGRSGGTRRTRFSMGNDRPAGEAAAGAALRARSGVDVRVVAVGHRSRSRGGPGRCGHRVPPREHRRPRRPRRAPPTRDGLRPPRPVSPA